MLLCGSLAGLTDFVERYYRKLGKQITLIPLFIYNNPHFPKETLGSEMVSGTFLLKGFRRMQMGSLSTARKIGCIRSGRLRR